METRKREAVKDFLVGLVIFLIINIGFYLFVFRRYNPIYGINDDWTLYMVISGSYLGYPEPRVNYMMYPLAQFLGVLYSITDAIPWYGIMLQGLLALCGFLIYFRIYNYFARGWKKLIVSFAALVVFLFAHLGIITLIQYTQVGAICGATAIFLFFTAKTKDVGCKEYLVRNIPTILMATLSLNIRENTLYMCLPIAGMMFLAKWWMEDGKVSKEVVVRYSGLLLALAVTLGGTIVAHKIAYSSPEWKEYVEVNNIWTNGVDYYGFPSYEEIEPFLTDNKMTREDYEISLAFQTFYRGEMPYTDFLTGITRIAKEKYDREHTFEVKLQEANEKIVECLTIDTLRPLNLVAVFLFVLVVGFLVGLKNKQAWVAFLCYLFGRFFAWYFLLFAGRFPERIAQGLLSMDFMVLIGCFLYFGLERKDTVYGNIPLRLAGSLLTILGMVAILWNGVRVQDGNLEYVDIYRDRWYGMKEYCQEHPENRYFLSGGSQTLQYFSDEIFETDTIGKPQNMYSNTNFDSPSPNFYNMMGAEYGSYLGDDMIEQEQNYWIYEKGCFSEELSIIKFYKSEYDNFEYELVDTFETQTSGFEVYHFSK